MTILEKEDIKKINEVIDYIAVAQSATVGYIKRKFNLTKEEYDMISDLMMPAIRQRNNYRNMQTKYTVLQHAYDELADKYEDLKSKKEDPAT